MKQTIKISQSKRLATIDIEGVIGPDPQNDKAASYQNLQRQIEAIKEIDSPMILVNIRSSGGDVADALLIYEALVSVDAHITTRCYGYTASAATIIAQAANEGCREIAQSALYLIHNSSCATEGNATELSNQVALLKQTDERIATIYASRSGKPTAHFAALMDKNNGNGVWLSPEQAVEAGLADVIITPDTSSSPSLMKKIASWLGLKTENNAKLSLPEKCVNIRSSEFATLSAIALSDGQSAVKPTTTKAVDDPDINGNTTTANSEAYNRDLAAFN
ncbi:MAG: Clp protease ClpP [Alistipes sp.]|nr:Clp protease ClpP [Alistipes sp.]